MRIIDAFDPSSATSGAIQVGAVNVGSKILLYNLSLVTIKLSFQTGATDLLHAGEARFWVLDGDTPTIQWTKYSSLNATTPPISTITGTLYEPSEPIPGVYPISINYQTTVGNTGAIQVTGVPADSIVNASSPAGTPIVTARPIGDLSDATNINNQGQMVLGSQTRTGRLAMFYGSSIELVTQGNQPGTGGSWVVSVDVNGTLHFSPPPGSRKIHFDSVAAGDVEFNMALGQLSVSTPGSTINGSTSGTATVIQDQVGTFKRIIIIQNNFRNGGASNQDVALPTPFVSGCRIWTGDTNSMQLLLSGAAQNMGVLTAVAAAGGSRTVQTTVNSYSFADTASAFDTIRFTSGAASAHNGVTYIIGV